MAATEKRVRVTLDLGDPALYRAIRHAAIERNQSVRAIVVEALRKWLEEQEDQEDIEAIRARRGEETYPWEQVKAEMRQARESVSDG